MFHQSSDWRATLDAFHNALHPHQLGWHSGMLTKVQKVAPFPTQALGHY